MRSADGIHTKTATELICLALHEKIYAVVLVGQLAVEGILEPLQTWICLPWNGNCRRLVFRGIDLDEVLQFVIVDIVCEGLS